MDDGAGGRGPPATPPEGVASDETAGDEIAVEQAHPGTNPIATSSSLTVRELGPALAAGADLGSVLASVPGAHVRRLGGLGDTALVSLRGSNFRQVEIHVDGLPLNPDGSEAVDLSSLPPSAFQRVEAWRGNAPARYASSAIGGVLDLRTNKGAIPTNVGVASGSWGTSRGWAVAGGALGSDGAQASPGGSWTPTALLAVEGLTTRGDWTYLDDRGTRYNTGDDATVPRARNALARGSVLARVQAGPREARFTLLDSASTLARDLPGPIGMSVERAEAASARNLLGVSADLAPSAGWRVQPRAWWLARTDRLDDPDAELGVGAEARTDRFDTGAAQLGVTWLPDPRVQFDLLGRVRREAWTPHDARATVQDDPRTRDAGALALSADLRAWQERLTFTPVVQVEALGDVRADGGAARAGTPFATAGQSSHAWVLPRAGLLVRPVSTLALKANAGRYVRAPDLLEQFGNTGTITGNPELAPERGFAWDVGARWVGTLGPLDDAGTAPACVAIDGAYASIDATDRITWVQNSQRTTRAVNVAGAALRTVEVGLEVEALRHLRSRTAATWMSARNEDPDYAGNALPRLPARELRQDTTLHGRGWALSHELSHTSATWLDTANLEQTAPRTLHALAARWSIVGTGPLTEAQGRREALGDGAPGRAGGRSGTEGAGPLPPQQPGELSFSVDVRNLLDVRSLAVDRNPLSDADDTSIQQALTDFAGYPLPGRTILVSLTWSEGARPGSPP